MDNSEPLEEKGVWQKYLDEEFKKFYYINKETGQKTYVRPLDYDNPKKKEERKTSFASLEKDLKDIFYDIEKEKVEKTEFKTLESPRKEDSLKPDTFKPKRNTIHSSMSNLHLPIKPKAPKSVDSSPILYQNQDTTISPRNFDSQTPKLMLPKESTSETIVTSPRTPTVETKKESFSLQKVSSFLYPKKEKSIEKTGSFWDGLKNLIGTKKKTEEKSSSSINLKVFISPRKSKDFYNTPLPDMMNDEKEEIPQIILVMFHVIKESLETKNLFVKDEEIYELKKKVSSKRDLVDLKKYKVQQLASKEKYSNL